MQSGTVLKWISDRGFGFIAPSGGGKDIFVHHSGIAGEGFRELQVGERVTFEMGAGMLGRPCAVKVCTVEDGE